MASTTARAVKAQERITAMEYLREVFPSGATVTVDLAHVSRSGMQRGIKVLAVSPRDGIQDASWAVARALDWRLHRVGGVKVDGCGMDMGFHLVYSLAHALYGDGYALKHRWI